MKIKLLGDVVPDARTHAEADGLRPNSDPTWPNDASWVTRRLKESRLNLESVGVTFEERVPLPGKKYGIRFRRVTADPTVPSPGSSPSSTSGWLAE